MKLYGMERITRLGEKWEGERTRSRETENNKCGMCCEQIGLDQVQYTTCKSNNLMSTYTSRSPTGYGPRPDWVGRTECMLRCQYEVFLFDCDISLMGHEPITCWTLVYMEKCQRCACRCIEQREMRVKVAFLEKETRKNRHNNRGSYLQKRSHR